MAEEGAVVNVYMPPKAALDLPSVAVPPKPWAVLLIQIIAWPFLFVLCGLIIVGCTQVALGTSLSLKRGTLALDLGVSLVIAATSAAMLFGIRQRLPLGRVLGVAYLVALAFPLLLLFEIFSPVSDADGLISRIGALTLVIVPTSYWIYALGFSAKARHYFSSGQRLP